MLPLDVQDPDVPVAGVVPVESMAGEDVEDTLLLRKMAETAEAYVSSFTWCSQILRSFFAGGVGGVFAIFLLHIRSERRDVDPWMWTVVGDVPPAYLPLADAKSAKAVFHTYMTGMSKWVDLARQGKSGIAADGVPPIAAPATPELAAELEHRLNTLRLIIQPFFDDSALDALN